jgi:biotin carboxylase
MSMRGKHVLFVESNTTGTGALAVIRLLESGARVTFLARQPEMYSFLSNPIAGLSVVVLDTNDVETVTAYVENVRRLGLNAVLTFSEFYVEIVAEVAARCGFRYLSPTAARNCRNKFETRRVLQAAGLATPRFSLVTSEEEARQAACEASYPCVIKPLADSSSKGVMLVRDGDELFDHFRRLHSFKINGRGQPSSGHVLIESLLQGPEVSIETMTLSPTDIRVIGITAKHLSPPPFFVEIGHDFPALLREEEAAAIRGTVLSALGSVGFNFGPAHTEVRLTASGPVVVEINPRLAGGMIPELIRYALGIDLLAALLHQLCGDPVDLTPRLAEWASICFLTASRGGRLVGVSGTGEAQRFPGIREVSISKRLGVTMREAEEAADRIGFVIASGPSRPQVLLALHKAVESIRLEIDSSPP